MQVPGASCVRPTKAGEPCFQERFSFEGYPSAMAAAVCVLVALASLALPSGPTYDPYAWLIWGRDLAHLDLVTSGGGTSWKPLPALIDALLMPLGGIAAQGWLVVARAGALFAVYMAFRLAWRLAPRPQRALAGLCAAAALVVSHEWLRRNGVGDAEGLGTAFGLLAVDRHLDGKNGQAYGLIVAAALIRVEAWPFALGYGAWIWWRREHRLEVALLAAAIPVAWFGGDWLGSGSAATAANRALHPIPGSPGASAHPARAVVAEALTMLPPAAWVAIAAATVAALWTRSRASATTATWRLDAASRRRIDSAVLWLCAAAA